MPRENVTILSLFQNQCSKSPKAIAVEAHLGLQSDLGFNRLTYRQLNQSSSELRDELRRHGVQPGATIPLLTSRSLVMVVAILGILKTGASYLPIDMEALGADRIEKVLDITKPSLVLTTTAASVTGYRTIHLSPNLHSDPDGLIKLGIRKGDVEHQLLEGPPPVLYSSDPAYIIFTSGTTGKPKGVVVSHSSIANYVQQGEERGPPFNLNVVPGSRVLLIQSIAFDAATGVVFSTLCNGGTLFLADFSTFPDVAKICTTLPLTPSVLETLDPLAGYDGVEYVFLGGESPSAILLERWSSPSRRIFNAYGPTETTCASLMAELHPGKPVLLGEPMSNSRVILIDENGNECDEGEILISGPGLAIGYYKNDWKTAESFVQIHGTRYYRTGDMAKRTNAGMKFCGRRDTLVKNRGFLVNLETEVEPALLSHPDVLAAVALMHEGSLIAFVKPLQATYGLKDFLSNRYSSFMVPDLFYGLDEIPITTNGKVDRQVLRNRLSVEQTPDSSAAEGAPSSEREAVMVAFAQTLSTQRRKIHDSSSFRELGGTSLRAVAAATFLRRCGFIISAGKILQLDVVAKIERALCKVEALTEETGSENGTKIQDGSILESSPMLDMHRKLVQGTIENPQRNVVRLSMTFDHAGIGSISENLHNIFEQLLNRHRIFYTAYDIVPEHGLVPLESYTPIDWQEREVHMEEFEAACAEEESLGGQIISTSKEGPLSLPCFFKVVSIAGVRSRLIWTVHHAMIDGWTMSIFMSDLAAIASGRKLNDPPQFSDISKAVKTLEAKNYESAVQFWTNHLTPHVPPNRMLLPKPDQHSTYVHSQQKHDLSIKCADLELWCQRWGTSAATFFYGTWALLLANYSDANSVIIGATLSGRDLPVHEIEQVVGPVLNVLPLGVRIDEETPLETFMHDVFVSLCSMAQYQWSSSQVIKDSVDITPFDLFESVIAMQWELPALEWTQKKFSAPREFVYNETTEIPLSLLVEVHDNSYQLQAIHDSSIFSNEHVERMMAHYRNLLQVVLVSAPNQLVGIIQNQMIDGKEIQSLVNSFPQLEAPYLGPMTVAESFDGIVQSHATLKAVESSGRSISYSELDTMTNTVAHAIQPYSGREKVVAILADGSLNWVIAIIACIKSGSAYCPIDCSLPISRQRLLLRQSMANLLLVPTSEMLELSSLSDDIQRKSVEALLASDMLLSGNFTRRQILPEDTAVIIFTSGTTGIPKGVPLQNLAICSAISEPRIRFKSKPGQRNAQCMALGFDICALEVFSALCFGATLVLKDPEDPFTHLSQVDAAAMTPTFLSTLNPAEYDNIKLIFSCGEPIQQSLVEKWATSDRDLINGYGPAECTFISLSTELHPGEKVHIGQPPARLAYYILDSKRRIIPDGMTGELYISGIQVSSGYINNPKETAYRFLPDPFRPGMPMYRTGDLCRKMANGHVEYIGRKDFQVKLRGYRIEPEDIEATVIESCPAVSAIAVAVVDETLIAFVTPSSIEKDSLRQKLSDLLPSYCQITQIIALEKLPQGSSGKTDRRALQQLAIATPRHIEPLATDMEVLVASIWKKVIGYECPANLSALDRFFGIGGHSILQVRVAIELSTLLGIPGPLKIVLRHQVLRDLARALDHLVTQTNPIHQSQFSSLQPKNFRQNLPVSHLEKELWNISQIEQTKSSSNMPFAVRLKGHIDLWRLARAFQNVIKKDDILHSCWKMVDGELVRVITQTCPALRVLANTGDIPSLLQQQVDVIFDLSRDQPIRVSVLQESEDSIVLLVVMHHIAGDATGLKKFMRDVFTAYSVDGTAKDYSPESCDKPKLSYADWAIWIKDQITDSPETSFWKKNLLQSPPAALGFGIEKKPPSHAGTCGTWTVEASLAKLLDDITKQYFVTHHHIVTTAVVLANYALHSTTDVVLGIPYANRHEPGTEEMAGLFLDSIPVRISFDFDTITEIGELLSLTRENSQKAISHYLPYTHIIRAIHGPTATSRSHPLYGVMVTFHMADEGLESLLSCEDMPVSEAEILPMFPSGAKFPVMFEFFQSKGNGDILVHCEYDNAIFDENAMMSIEETLALSLRLLAERKPIQTIVQTLRQRSKKV